MFQLELQTSKVLASEMIITEIQVTKTEIIWLGNYQGDDHDHDHHDHHISCQCMQILQKHPRMTQPPMIRCYIVVCIALLFALRCIALWSALRCIALRCSFFSSSIPVFISAAGTKDWCQSRSTHGASNLSSPCRNSSCMPSQLFNPIKPN